MMKLLTCTLVLVVTAGLAMAQVVDIDDIQYYNPADGSPASPYDGQQVIVIGSVTVVPGTYNSGTTYIQDATGGIAFFQSGTGLELGDVVEVTATVGSYSGEIQLNSVSPGPATPGDEPIPAETTPTGILGAAEPYEWVGLLAAVNGDVVEMDTSPPLSWFKLADTGGGTDTLYVYVDSDTGIDLSGMTVGEDYKVIGPIVNYNGLIELKPRMPADMIDDPTLPIIRKIDLQDWVPLANEPIAVDATVTDDQGVAAATIHYRGNDLDGENPGAWATASMSHMGGNDWTGSIPGLTDAKVDFYVSVEDMEGQTVVNPGAAPDSYLECAIGLTSIYDLQWVHPDSSDQTTPYDGKVVNLRGVITAGTGDMGVNSKFIMQEQETGPYGGYRYGAVLSYLGSGYGDDWYVGDVVEVGGHGFNYYGLDQINPHNRNSVYLISYGNELPPAERATTQVFSDDNMEDGNGRRGEAYECVWVKTYVAEVLGVGEYNEYWISDTGAWADSLAIQPLQDLTYIPTVGDFLQIEGFMDYAYGDYVVRPLGDEGVIFSANGVEDTPTVTDFGGFKAVYPNPFNPATKMEFRVGQANVTQLNIYNVRGEFVRSLVNEQLPMGDYTMTWDGRDEGGEAVASGQYFARLRIGSEVMQVRKLSLVK